MMFWCISKVMKVTVLLCLFALFNVVTFVQSFQINKIDSFVASGDVGEVSRGISSDSEVKFDNDGLLMVCTYM